MGQILIENGEEHDSNKIKRIFKICNLKKINKVMEYEGKYMILYDDAGFRGENNNIIIIPESLFLLSYKKLIVSDFIDIDLKYFPHVIEKFKNKFPHIYKYMQDQNITEVRIKPSTNITETSINRIDMGLKDIKDITGILMNQESAKSLDLFIIAEIIRRFYMGEKNHIQGFLIYKTALKYIKAIVKEELTSEYLFEKLESNPNIVNNDNFFKGTDGKFVFKIFDNEILICPKKSIYLDKLDLKFLSTLVTIGTLLNEKRFGKPE